jgi:hypothetical protein
MQNRQLPTTYDACDRLLNQQLAHAASFSRVGTAFVRICPLEASRKISIVFEIFHLARKNLSVCGWCELSAELLESISQ